MSAHPAQPCRLRLVLVDDDEGDRNLVLRALRGLGFSLDIEVASDAQSALECMEREKTPAKTLVLLDLNLITHDGREVLRALGATGRLGCLAVVVFTNSRRPEDVVDVYELGARSFLQKPSTYPELKMALSALFEYWFDVVELPLAS